MEAEDWTQTFDVPRGKIKFHHLTGELKWLQADHDLAAARRAPDTVEIPRPIKFTRLPSGRLWIAFLRHNEAGPKDYDSVDRGESFGQHTCSRRFGWIGDVNDASWQMEWGV